MKPGLSCAGAEFGMQDAGVLHEALQIAVVLARTWMSKPLLNRLGDPRVSEKSSAGDGAGYPRALRSPHPRTRRSRPVADI
jgi:hypothetical protein